MLKLCSRFVSLGLPFALLITFANETIGAELTVQIRSPNDGAQITQEQAYLSGRREGQLSEADGSGYVDIFIVLDVSEARRSMPASISPNFLSCRIST